LLIVIALIWSELKLYHWPIPDKIDAMTV